jgi:hypothetical protein
MFLPNHNYKFYKELPLENLESYKNHRRLRHYYTNGYCCAKCDAVCSRLIWGKTKEGTKHLDMYNQDLTLMLTLGHIIPKARGGDDSDENIRPLCHVCNYAEGAGFEHFLEEPELFDKLLRGKYARRMNGNPFQNGRKYAKIDRIFISPHHQNKLYFGFVEGFTYNANKCVLPKTKNPKLKSVYETLHQMKTGVFFEEVA